MATASPSPTYLNITPGYGNPGVVQPNGQQGSLTAGTTTMPPTPTQGTPIVYAPGTTGQIGGNGASTTTQSGGPTNSYSVVTAQPAQDQINAITTDYNTNIKPGMANQITKNANNAVLPSIPGYNVSATKTGAQGETQATNNTTGQSYYITPQTPPEPSGSQLLGAYNNAPTVAGTTIGTNTTGIQNTTPSPTDQSLANLQTGVTQNMSDLDNAYAQYTQAVTQLQNGTFPLNTAQTALVNATNSAFNNMMQNSQLKAAALSSETGGISTKINATMGEMGNIETEQAAAVAKLEEGFQTQNYALINDQYTAFKDLETQKTANLTALNTAITTASQNAIANAQKQEALNQTEKQNAATDAQAAADLAEKYQADYITAQGTWTIHDNTDGTESLVNSKTGATQSLSPNNIITGGGQPGSTGVPILDNNTKTSSSGIPYIDGSALTGKTATAAQNQAAQMGIPYMDKTNATIMNGIETSRQNLQNIAADLQGISPDTGLGRPFKAIGHFIEGVTQIGPGAAGIQAYKDDISSMVQTVKSELGQNNVPRALIQPILDNMPTVNDTSSVVTAKIAKLNNALNAVEKGIIGGTIYDEYNPDSAITDLQSFSSASPEHAQQIASIRAAQPNLTPDQVLQLVQP